MYGNTIGKTTAVIPIKYFLVFIQSTNPRKPNWHLPCKFKEIMEDWSASMIPIIADMEVTTNTWADKVEVETIEELKERINHV